MSLSAFGFLIGLAAEKLKKNFINNFAEFLARSAIQFETNDFTAASTNQFPPNSMSMSAVTSLIEIEPSPSTSQ